MATFTEKIKKRIAPDDSYKMEVLPEAAKSMAKLGFTNEHYKSSWFEEYILWPIERKIDFIKDIPDNIKYFIQRGRRGYSTRDVWDMHSYLQEVIPGMLRELINHKSMMASHPIGWKEIKNHNDWKRIILKMAKDIEEGGRYDDLSEDWSDKKREAKFKQFNEGIDNLHKYWFNLWD